MRMNREVLIGQQWKVKKSGEIFLVHNVHRKDRAARMIAGDGKVFMIPFRELKSKWTLLGLI